MRALHPSDSQPIVLLGFAEALAAPEVVWSLVDAGYRVLAFARRGRGSALRYSRHVEVHEITPPEESVAAATSELSALLEQIGTKVAPGHILFPIDDASVWLGARLPLSINWIFAGPSPEKAELALDKRKQIEVANAAGFHVPETSVISAPEDLESCLECLPIILRPALAVWECNSRLTRGSNWICSDRPELERVGKKWQGRGALLAQPFLQGVGEGIFGLATEKGVVAWSAHRRLRMMNPHGSGSSACVSQPVPDGVKEPVEKFIEATGWRGLFMIEMLNSGGHRYFVEFNGRSWGSMALARARGLEYPAWAVRLALDPKFRPNPEKEIAEETEARNFGRELMHLLFVLRGSKSAALQEWPGFWRTLFAMLSFRHTTRFYNWRRDDPKVFWTDTASTLRDNLIKRKS